MYIQTPMDEGVTSNTHIHTAFCLLPGRAGKQKTQEEGSGAVGQVRAATAEGEQEGQVGVARRGAALPPVPGGGRPGGQRGGVGQGVVAEVAGEEGRRVRRGREGRRRQVLRQHLRGRRAEAAAAARR